MDSFKDLLNSEINKKKRELNKLDSISQGKKYFRRNELERLEKEKYLEEQRKLEEERNKKKALKEIEIEKNNEDNLKNSNKEEEENTKLMSNLPDEEITRRLRNRGQPIRLFGELEHSRRLRLRALELIEERSDGQRNDYADIMEAIDDNIQRSELLKGQTKTSKDYTYLNVDTEGLNVELMEKDLDLTYKLVYIYFKRALKMWEIDMDQRDESIKRSAQGKKQAATQMQCAEYIKPFFKQLKKKNLDISVLKFMVQIIEQLQLKEYSKANDYYLRLSIGNAPWPIGVTMVGIHERSGREKIHSNQIAHVLNDETQRKWIQSVKRIMTYLQGKFPPDDLSKCVG